MKKENIKSISSKFKINLFRIMFRTVIGTVFDALMKRKRVAIPRGIYNIQGMIPVFGIKTTKQKILDIKTEIHKPKKLIENQDNKKIILYSHGGGYSIGSTKSHKAISATLSKTTQIPVLTYSYRLAPEFTYRAGIEDATSLYSYLLDEQKYKPENIILVGDSAGSSLCFEIMKHCRENNLPEPKAICAISPLFNYDITQMNKESKKHIILSPKLCNAFYNLSGIDSMATSDNLINRNFSNYPPVLIQTGTDDVIYQQAIQGYEKLKSFNNPGKIEIWENMWHVWHGMLGTFKEAELAIKNIAKFIDKQYE